MDDHQFSQRDVLAASKWSSVLFTTYSLSLSFLESVPLAAVARSFRDVTVLTDVEGYVSSLSDVGAIGVGRDYDLVAVRVSGGVFHPKIALMSDPDGNIRATVGSGNLSFGGWGYNNEVLDVLVPGEDSQCFGALAGMLERIARNDMAGGRLECLRRADIQRHIDVARRAAAVPGPGRSRFLHTMDGSLLPSIADMAAELGGARSLTVVSPFFSAHRGVAALAQALGCDDVAVAVPPRAPEFFDFEAARASGLKCRSVSSPVFADMRSLHSKAYDIECASGRLVITGSANATEAALLGRNVEAVVARPVDLAVRYGWTPSGTFGQKATGEAEPRETSAPGLVLDYDGGWIAGGVVGNAEAGRWNAWISSGVRRYDGGPVEVDASGRFRFEPPSAPAPDLLAMGSAVRVSLVRDGTEIAGWLILRDLLDAILKRGPVTRSITRILGGLDTDGDLAAVVEYLARNPELLFESAERTRRGRSVRQAAARKTDYSGTVSEGGTDDGPDAGPVWPRASSADGILDVLVRHFASSLPGAVDDDEDEEDDADLGSRTKPPGGTRRSPDHRKDQPRQARGVDDANVTSAFDRMFKKLKELPRGTPRGPSLLSIFDIIKQVAPRTQTRAVLQPSLLRRWLAEAAAARAEDDMRQDLDRYAAVAAASMVLDDPTDAGAVHELLESWLGSELDDEFRILCEPSAAEREERCLSPGRTDLEWKSAWALICTTATPRSRMRALQKAIMSGGEVVIPEAATPEEAASILKAAAQRNDPKRIWFAEGRRSETARCNKCYRPLKGLPAKRLKADRITTCDDIRCRRINIDVSV